MSEPSVGKPLDRVDGRRKVTGAARYAADIPVSNLAYAVIVSSGVARGRVASIDAAAVEALPGVLAVLTSRNAMRLPPAPEKKSPVDRVLQVLQDDSVVYSNQPVAVVVADTLERAQHGAAALVVRYEAAPFATNLGAELGKAFTPEKAGGGGAAAETARGDVDKGMASSEVKLEATYTMPIEPHNPLEPHATIAVWQGDQKLTVYDATQGIFEVRRKLSASLGLPKENVRVISHFLGGGFGCKGSVWSHVLLAAMAARQVGRPVKLVLTRQQMFGPVGYRPRMIQKMSVGASKKGALVALRHESTSNTSSFDTFVEPAALVTRMLYACPNVATAHRLVKLDLGTPTFTRAPGEGSGSFALESAMDELSYALSLDPLELRLRNHADRDPQEDKPWSSKSLRECYKLGAERFGWARRTPAPRSMRDGDRLIGWGFATATYPANLRNASASASLLADGTAHVLAGSQDIGTGTYTIMTQLAADALGLPPGKVRFELGDTEMPETPGSGGSQTAATVGSAVHGACTGLRAKLVQMAIADAASPLSGAAEADIDAGDGRLFLRKDPSRGEPFEAILTRAGKKELVEHADTKPSDERKKYSCHSFGAQFIEVSVDPDLGEVRVTRALGVFAAGRILNAKTARSQFQGGIVWGLSMALHENAVVDHRLGRIMTRDLADYHVPVNADVPAIEALFIEEKDPYVNAIGVKGIGEIGITGVAAAVANAVYHATGKRIRDLPITPDKLL